MLVINIPHNKYQIVIKCCDEDLERILSIQYYPYIDYSFMETDKLIAYITQYDDATIALTYDKNEIIVNTKLHQNLIVIRKIIQSLLIFEDNFIALHASCVSLDSSAVFIIGKTMSGKSTLTSYLMSEGFSYLTDDFTLINLNSLSVIPFRKIIHIRKGTHQFLYDNNIKYPALNFQVEDFYRQLILPPLINEDVNFNVVAGIFIDRDEDNFDDSINEIKNLSKKRDMCVKNLFTSADLINNIKKVNDLVTRIPFYHTRNNLLESTASRITNTINELINK